MFIHLLDNTSKPPAGPAREKKRIGIDPDGSFIEA
jgi:hypothetical protein